MASRLQGSGRGHRGPRLLAVAAVVVLATVLGASPAVGRTSWQQTGSLGVSDVSLGAIACVSTSLCTTVGGGGLLSFDPGNPTAALPAGGSPEAGVDLEGPIACPQADLCVAFGFPLTGEPVVIYNPASPARTIRQSLGIGAAGVSCPSVTLCVVVGSDVGPGAAGGGGGAQSFDPRDGSVGVHLGPYHGHGFSAVSCPSTTQCTVVADGGEFTYDPATYDFSTPAPTLDSVDAGATITALDCPTTSVCVAIDQTGGAVSFDPNNPGTPAPAVIDPGHALTGLACPDTASCTAVDDAGGEVTFSAAAPANGQRRGLAGGPLHGVACPAVTLCSATADGGMEVSFDPASGAGVTAGKITDEITIGALACPTGTECVGTLLSAGPASELTFDPTAPSGRTPQIFDPNEYGADGLLACPTATQCTTFDSNLVTFAPVHAATAPVTLSNLDPLSDGLACPTATQCTAVAGSQEQTFDPARSPGYAPVTLDQSTDNSGTIACRSVSRCTLVARRTDGSNTAVTFDPASPSSSRSATLPGTAQPVTALVCPETTSCVALAGGAELTFDPRNVSRAHLTSIDPSPTDTLTGLACPEANRCLVVDSDNRVMEFDPETSTRPVSATLPGATQLQRLACDTAQVCTAVDLNGLVFRGIGWPRLANGSRPSIRGRMRAGVRLQARTGAWTGTPRLRYRYRWQRCARRCITVRSATRATYRLGRRDVGRRLRIIVTASNAAGSMTRASRSRGPVRR